MNPEIWTHARAIFDQLVGVDPATRARDFSSMDIDDEVRRAVSSLLTSHDQLANTGSDLFANEILHAVSTLLPGVEIGDRFGAFEITEELGRGGMGVVYKAKRHDGSVQQVVALKVLLYKHHDADSVRRLNRERQLLARLEHPHIARLIDAGENAQGIPYFAMEYVHGVPITRYCDDRAMSVAQRIALFRAVCSAVLHAHTHLVVHGDLKPGNILVTDEGLPKLLDFGIAVSLRRETETHVSTAEAESEPRFFSANSAAPEQLGGERSNIATDIYSLGVLLCEMLGGRRPYELNDLTLSQSLSVVGKQPPMLPSVAATSASATLRGFRSSAALKRNLRGDLDAIVGKALSNRPELRYVSVEQFIQDLDRNSTQRPVAARRHERGYSAQRFVQRNMLVLGFAVLTAVLLLGFLSYALIQNRRLSEERDAAHRQEQQAQFERDRAQQVTDFLIDLFRSADPAKALKKDITARELLEKGARQLETDLGQQPLMRAAMLAAIADIHIELDDLDLAEAAANQAWQLRRDVQPPDSGAHAASLRQIARLAILRGHAKEALANIDQAITLDSTADLQTRVDALTIRAQALEGAGEPKEAVTVWRQALDLADAEPDNGRALRVAFNLARSLRAQGNLPEAEQVIRIHLATSDQNSNEEARAIRSSLILELAVIARNRGDLEEASALAQQGYDAITGIYDKDSSQVATAANTLATILQAKGDLAGARQLFERSLEIKRKVYGSDNPRVASAEYNLGLLLLRLKDLAGAVRHLQIAVEIGSRTLPPTHSNLANYRLGYGSALRDLGRFEDARAQLEPALITFQRIGAPRGIDVALSQGEIACSTRTFERRDASELARLKEAVARLRKEAPDDPQSRRIFDCLEHWR